MSGSPAFKTDGTRYAFGFAAATAQAQNVNIDSTGLADYKAMDDSQCAVLHVGELAGAEFALVLFVGGAELSAFLVIGAADAACALCAWRAATDRVAVDIRLT